MKGVGITVGVTVSPISLLFFEYFNVKFLQPEKRENVRIQNYMVTIFLSIFKVIDQKTIFLRERGASQIAVRKTSTFFLK